MHKIIFQFRRNLHNFIFQLTFGYIDQAVIEQGEDEDTQRLIREYDPSWEFVVSLLKSEERMSSYRIGVIARDDKSGKT